MTPPDILERLKELDAKTDRAFPSLGETVDEIERLREEVETWRSRYEAERQDHEATMKAWDEERSGM